MRINALLLITAWLFACCSSDSETQAETMSGTSGMTMNITIDGQTLTVILEDNAATRELTEALQQAPITYQADDYGGFEKVGALGRSLTTSNQQITTQAGDVILYSGNQIVLFYGSNSWSYTRLGRIQYESLDKLKSFLKAGRGSVSVTLSLPDATAIQHIDASKDQDVYYSLNGQRVEHPTNGVYIKYSAEGRLQGRNGKKVIL